MWSTSHMADVLDNLCTQLSQRPGLADVSVLSAPMREDTPRRAIVFSTIESDQAWAALGNRARTERMEIDAWVWVVVAGAGDGVAKTARTYAMEIIAEIEQQLREDWRVGMAPVSAQVVRAVMDQGIHTDGRWCQVDLVIQADVQLRGISPPVDEEG